MKKNKKELELVETDEWKLYERGVDYNRNKDMYTDTDRNFRFNNGDQWQGAELDGIQPITLNIVRPIIKYKTGIVNSNGYAIVFSPNNYDNQEFQKEMQDLCIHLNKFTSVLFEQKQMDLKIRKIVRHSAINSEGVLFNYFDEKTGDIETEIINKTNIYYGNENDDDIQKQPYIIITFREDVDKIKEIAEANKLSADKIELIVSDKETQEQAGDEAKEEVNDRCLCLLKLYKKNGKVYFKKSTRYVVYEEGKNTDMTLYPVAHMTWEDVEGSARGEGEVKYLIPNQIEINKTALRRAISVKMGAYPVKVVNKSKIANPEALNEIGATIEIDGSAIDDVKKYIGYLNPATMSSDSEKLQTELIQMSRELAGAGDIATGDINPEKASGRAILAVKEASQQPLTEQLIKFKTFLEDVARIWFDMWQAYKIDGLTIIKKEIAEDETEIDVPYKIPHETLKTLKVNTKIDITPKSPFDRYALEASLEQLLEKQHIQFEEYIKALPMDSVMPKSTLEKIIKDRQEAKKKIDAMNQQIQQFQSDAELSLLKEQLQGQSFANEEISRIQGSANTDEQALLEQIIGGAGNEMSAMPNSGDVA